MRTRTGGLALVTSCGLALLAGCGSSGNAPSTNATIGTTTPSLEVIAPETVKAGEEFTIDTEGDSKLIKSTILARNGDEIWALTGVVEGEEGAPEATHSDYVTAESDAYTDSITFKFDPSTSPGTYETCLTIAPFEDKPADQRELAAERKCVGIDVVSTTTQS